MREKNFSKVVKKNRYHLEEMMTLKKCMEVGSIQNLELTYIAELLPHIIQEDQKEAEVEEARAEVRAEARAEARGEGEVGAEERELINQFPGYLTFH